MRVIPLTIIAAILSLSSLSHGYSLQKKSATSVIFQTNGQPVSENQEFYVVDQANKPKLLVRVEKFNSNQAKAKVIKGNPAQVQVGWVLRPTRSPASVPDASTTSGSIPTKFVKPRNAFGVMGTYMMSSMNAKFSFNSVNQTAAMSGSSMGVLGFYDLTLNKNLQVRALGGIENFEAKQAKETAVCEKGLSKECNVKINYFSMYAMGKYNVTKSKNKFWIGGGLGYLLATGKSSTVLDTSLITSNQVLVVGLGLDIGIGPKNIMPVSVDYSLFPSSSTVSASIISFKVGYGFGQ